MNIEDRIILEAFAKAKLASESNITNYKYSIGMAYNDFFKNYIKQVHFSGRELALHETQFKLLNAYIEVMMNILFPSSEITDLIPITLDEIKVIEYKINRICGTNYSIFQNLTPIISKYL